MENEFEEHLRKAREAGCVMQASKTHSSRAHSIAMTNLETAELWARQDSKEKADIVAKQAETTGGN